MAYPPEIKLKLRTVYVHQRLPLEAAASTAGVAVRTAIRWKQQALDAGDDWERARLASSMAGEGLETLTRDLLEGYLQLHQSTVKQLQEDSEATPMQKAEALSRLADAFNKTLNAAGKAAPSLSKLAVAMEVLQRLTRLIRERYPQHAETFLEVLEPLGEELASVYG